MDQLSTRPRTPLTLRRTILVVSVLLILLIAVCVIGLSIGSVSIPFSSILASLAGDASVSETERTIVLAIRLPRVLLAILVGAGLSVAGVVFQALLRNPLAEPYILGISSGGTVGAILAISLGAASVATPMASFIGAAAVMFLVYSIAHRRGHLDTNTLLLAGVMIGAFFNAAVLLMIAVFNQELRNAFLWLMGNLSMASIDSIAVVAPFILLASIALMFLSRSYNLIATGDETAMQLGVEVAKIKRASYILASLITGLAVSVSGVIGFVGLIIPHMCRMVFGPDHRLLIPASFLIGASFLILADVLSRTLIAPTEIPVGAVTAAIGAPLFVYLLKRT
ncbi:MAG: iron ABC transporter permease [Ignavibacteriae bacterium]|nr:iron ABC transporter permease [Ignavibacteriota bacterium]